MKTQCPNCKARFNVDDKFAGKQAKCPKCTKLFTIAPFVETPAPTTAPAPAKSPAAVQNPQPAASPVKSPEPIAPPVINPKVVAAPAKTSEPIKEEMSKSQPVSETPRKSGLSKIVFVYVWVVVRLIAGGLAGWGLMLALKRGERSTLIAAFAAADVFLVCSVLIELMLFYKMWAAIADTQTSTTPGKAVGFLFIPIFNLYWALNMIMAFAEDYNSFIERRSIKTKDLPLTLFMLYAFAFMLTMIFVTTPMLCVSAVVGLIARAFAAYSAVAWLLVALAVLAGLAHFIAYIFSATKTCDAVNALPG
ncbi:MAG: zinc-ribbon domain-containing protein [Sedimentisphaerales bacterium]